MPASATLRRDALLALLLALLLGVAWAWRDWADLTRLHLPDTDDVVRLQQIRDWLAGQPFADLTQHRLGSGLPMHWSRLADLGPGALIALLTPLLGAHAAEVATVTIWPPVLFAAALFLLARIARRLGGDGTVATAVIVAAIGFPATSLFTPGRIDHHGLQMVLLLGATLAVVRPACAGAGIAIGLLAAASLTVGLETAPLIGVIGAVAVIDWVLGHEDAAERLKGFGVGALVGLAAAKGIFATSAWTYPACDGFTGEAWRAALAIAPVPLLLAVADARLLNRRARAIAAAVLAAGAGGVALLVAPGCLHPYGGVDPVMARLWLHNVGEAQPLFGASPADAIGYAGLMIAGIACSAWRLRATRERGWAVLLALQLTAFAITCAQMRGAYAGALLAAPALAAAIAAARARGALPVAAAWTASAGMLYPIAAQALTPARPQPVAARGDCASPAMLAALNHLPVGEVIAPIDAGAYILGATRQRVVTAPYHRNGAGNRDAFRFYLGSAATAAAVADRWLATYTVSCAAMPGPARAAGLPNWRRAATLPDGAVIWTRAAPRS